MMLLKCVAISKICTKWYRGNTKIMLPMHSLAFFKHTFILYVIRFMFGKFVMELRAGTELLKVKVCSQAGFTSATPATHIIV